MSWKDIHFDSTVVDLHNHACMKHSMFSRNLGTKKKKFLSGIMERTTWPFSKRNTFPQMDDGGVDVVLSTNYIPEIGWKKDISTIKWVLRLFPSVRKKLFDPTYFDATIGMMDEMELAIEVYNKERPEDSRPVRLVTNKNALYNAINVDDDNPIAIVHSVEGGHSLHGEIAGKEVCPCRDYEVGLSNELLDNLDELYDRGVAYLTLAHFYKNYVSNPIFPYPEWSVPKAKWKEMYGRWDMNLGLTTYGKEIVRKMLDLGMLIDITHCTPTGRKEVYDIVDEVGATECLLASHMGCYELNRDPMNLEDWEIKWFADHGCVLGVILMGYWLSPVDTDMALKHIEQTVHHIQKVAGDDVAGIGTDLDGFTDPPDEIVSIDEMPRLTKYMAATNHYTEEQLEKFLGKNSMRLLLNGWKKE